VRLLVYGGNLYEERRRIGDWPETITAAILQEEYALSERKPAFGVGFSDEAPFLIFRRIQPHKDRSYPLTLLLDPGLTVWREYEWNGAHLLHALFIEKDSPGQKLLYEVERFNSAQDLEKLFEEISRKELPAATISEDEEKIWQWWFGSLTSAKPVVASPDGAVIGLNSRPLITSMAHLLARVIPSLRCGKGWLIGGHRGQVKPYGVHFVFDDGKDVTDMTEAAAQIQEALRAGQEQLAACDVALQFADDGLKDFFNLPLVQWEKQSGHTAQELFSDLKFLASISQPLITDSGEQSDQALNAVIERLEKGKGPLFQPIYAAASELARAGDGMLSPAKTRFILFYADRNQQSIADEMVKRLDAPTAIEFFAGKELYPAEADELIPETFRLEVSRRLLANETRYDQIPRILGREIKFSGATASQQSVEELAELAIERSSHSARSLTELWANSANHHSLSPLLKPFLKNAARSAVKEKVGNLKDGLDEASAALEQPWLADYLTFGEDDGGHWLAEQNLSGEPATGLLRLISKAAGAKVPRLNPKLAEDWLSELVFSELRARISIETKVEILREVILPSGSSKLRQKWAPLEALVRLFDGGSKSPTLAIRKIVAEHLNEQQHLLSELRELASRAADQINQGQPIAAPNLVGLLELLGNVYEIELSHILLGLRPSLAAPESLLWLKGWYTLSIGDHSEPGDGNLEKFRAEWIRLLLESDISVENIEPYTIPVLADFEEQRLLSLFDDLLFGTNSKQDERHAQRLLNILQIGGSIKTVKSALQNSFDRFTDESARDLFLRRYTQKQVLERLNALLTEEQRTRLTAVLEEKRKREIELCKGRVKVVLLSTPITDFDADFTLLKAEIDKEIFREAIGQAFEEIAAQDNDRQALLSRLYPNKSSLKLLNNSLPSESLRDALKGLRLDYEEQQKRLQIGEYLWGTNPEEDTDARNKLYHLLNSWSGSGIKPIVEAEVKAGISDPEKQGNFRRRFVQMKNVYRAKEQQVKALDSIFVHLEWATKKEILIFLYDSDKDLFSQMADDIFRDVQGKNISYSFYQNAFLQFLNTNHQIANTVRQQLITYHTGDKRKVLAVLKFFKAPEQEQENTEAPVQTEAEENDKPMADETEKRPWHKRPLTLVLGVAVLLLMFYILMRSLSPSPSPVSDGNIAPASVPESTRPEQTQAEQTPSPELAPTIDIIRRRPPRRPSSKR
jgi:hypothetical protein